MASESSLACDDLLREYESMIGDPLPPETVARKGISEALVELVNAQPDEEGRGLVCRALAAKMVRETLEASGQDYVRLQTMMLNYTDGLPVHRVPSVDPGESRERVITIQPRAVEYRLVQGGEDAEAG